MGAPSGFLSLALQRWLHKLRVVSIVKDDHNDGDDDDEDDDDDDNL